MDDLTQGQLFGLICTLFFLLKGIKETALHLAVRLEERSSLALVDFLCQNRSATGNKSSTCLVFMEIIKWIF